MRSPQRGYTFSHTAPGHGRRYDSYLSCNPHPKIMWLLEQRILTAFVGRNFAGRDIHFLDFACGTGRIAQLLEPLVEESIGVDTSASMLEVARSKLHKTRLIEANLIKNNVLGGRRFDLITAFRFFLNAEPPLRKNAMRILADLLSEDGYLIFNNHGHRAAPTVLYTYIMNRRHPNPPVLNVMSVQEMKDLVAGFDLEIVQMFHVGILFPRMHRLMPESWSLRIENAATHCKWLAPFSEDLIAVCRHRAT